MVHQVMVQIQAERAADAEAYRAALAAAAGCLPADITGFFVEKESLDARGRQPMLRQVVQVGVGDSIPRRPIIGFEPRALHRHLGPVVVVGAGPAGLFAALRLLEAGIKPIILERGKDVRNRRRDLAMLNKTGQVNPESNYCFGEGGAGTYSDGKLYTRSKKRGNIYRILSLLHHFGADERVLYEAHPHIGTNKLPQIIVAIREAILAAGGEILFEHKLQQLILQGDRVSGVRLTNGQQLSCHQVVLATGHSARDVFSMLYNQGIAIEAKPFALGVRVEHPQALIDQAQYRCMVRPDYLPPAAYSLVEQVEGRGVFSFCMCPGGIIAPAATAPNELVVNGWSPSKRNNPFANSGMVAEVKEDNLRMYATAISSMLDIPKSALNGPLGFMYFQQWVERTCFAAGGGLFVAPAQRIDDFIRKKPSTHLPACSYLPGISATNLWEVLPGFVATSLQGGLKAFGKKIKEYASNEGVMVATESRTSSPVRIPRHPETLEHIQVKGLYPCAEGAGYAGGIVSAAMDGEKVAACIAASVGCA